MLGHPNDDETEEAGATPTSTPNGAHWLKGWGGALTPRELASPFFQRFLYQEKQRLEKQTWRTI
jgi:hypothetical protein